MGLTRAAGSTVNSASSAAFSCSKAAAAAASVSSSTLRIAACISSADSPPPVVAGAAAAVAAALAEPVCNRRHQPTVSTLFLHWYLGAGREELDVIHQTPCLGAQLNVLASGPRAAVSLVDKGVMCVNL